jgi:anti-anti-sigma regulatory factor
MAFAYRQGGEMVDEKVIVKKPDKCTAEEGSTSQFPVQLDIQVYKIKDRVSVTVLQLIGNLDSASYRKLFNVAQDQYITHGARNLVIDLRDFHRITCAGLVALRNIAVLFEGEDHMQIGFGWPAIHSLMQPVNRGVLLHFKLACPPPNIEMVLKRVTFTENIEFFDSVETAIATF